MADEKLPQIEMVSFEPIGIIHTPYIDSAPFRPEPDAEGEFFIEVFEPFCKGLKDIDQFSHLIVLYYFDRTKKLHLAAHPPGYDGKEVGVFSSRSPFRPTKIGMNTVKIKSLRNNIIHTSPMDALDNTPLLDIKPYIPDLDCHPDANNGWLKQ